jgi:CheY-like chemotaxis protein
MAKKILIIEDELDIIAIYQVAMEGSGFEIITAKNGKIGLETAAKEKPDLIILDLLMPEMDGFGFLEAAKNDDQIKNIPIIVASNLGQSEDIDKAREYNIKDYLVKDRITPKDILEKIKKYV